MIRSAVIAFTVIGVGVALGATFMGGQLKRGLPENLPEELLRIVNVCGHIQVDVTEGPIEDVLSNREKLMRRLKADLPEVTESIQQLLGKLRPTLSIAKLEPPKREALLGLLPGDIRTGVDTSEQIKQEVILQIYVSIKKDALQDAQIFQSKLLALQPKPTDEQVSQLSNQRGQLTTSLGSLVLFSGLMQVLAVANTPPIPPT